MKCLATAVGYVCKDGKYKTNMEGVQDGVLICQEAIMIAKAIKLGVDPVLNDYIIKNPAKALGKKSATQLERELKTVVEVKAREKQRQQPGLRPAFTLANFNIPDIISQWIADGCQPSLILVGDSGIGKTQFALLIGELLQIPVLIVNDLQSLKKLATHHGVIIFDDFSSQDMNDLLWLYLFETDLERGIRILHKSIIKPAGLKQIFTFNKRAFRQITYLFANYEYSRRVRIVHVPSNFLNPAPVAAINFNIQNNIVTNNHTHIYNNKEAVAANGKALEEIRRSGGWAY